MKQWWIFIPVLICNILFATEELLETYDHQASKEHVLDQRQNYFLTSTNVLLKQEKNKPATSMTKKGVYKPSSNQMEYNYNINMMI